MPRIKLSPLESYTFATTIKLRVSDINYGGHLGNDALISLLHQARIEAFAELDLCELDLGDGRTGLIQTDAAVCYLGEAFMLDELVVESAFVEVKGSTFRMAHRVLRTGNAIALAELGFAGYDYAEHRMGRLPDKFLQKIR